MKTQPANTQMQGVLGYREVLQHQIALFHEPKPTAQQIRNLIHMAKRCSKSQNLDGERKAKLKDIADTWEKFL